nr:AsmA family protein [Candidatus Palauibacterales bacterium]
MSDESQLSESPAPRSRMTRRLAILAGAVLLLVVGSVVALKLIFTPEKLRALVVPRLEAALGREVQLSAVRLRLFPRIAVRLDEVAVASPAGFSSDPMLQLDALDLQVKLRPLLRREIVLGQVRLLNPLIRYEVLSDGTNNFSGLGGGRDTEEDAAGDAAGAAGAAAAGLLVTDLAIRGGRMVYADARSGRRAEFGIDARVSVERGEENTAILESSGRV